MKKYKYGASRSRRHVFEISTKLLWTVDTWDGVKKILNRRLKKVRHSSASSNSWSGSLIMITWLHKIIIFSIKRQSQTFIKRKLEFAPVQLSSQGLISSQFSLHFCMFSFTLIALSSFQSKVITSFFLRRHYTCSILAESPNNCWSSCTHPCRFRLQLKSNYDTPMLCEWIASHCIADSRS